MTETSNAGARTEPAMSSGESQPVVRHEAWWWVAEDGAPPAVPGFVQSSFNPLVAAVADRCLSEHYAKPPEPPGDRQRTGLVLVSRGGDRVSAEHVRQTVADGSRLGPLFFFQSVPNSIAGYVAARWGLGGPVVCISPVGSPVADGVAEAAVLMSDGDAEEVLLVIAEQAADGGLGGGLRARAAARLARRAGGVRRAPATDWRCRPDDHGKQGGAGRPPGDRRGQHAGHPARAGRRPDRPRPDLRHRGGRLSGRASADPRRAGRTGRRTGRLAAPARHPATRSGGDLVGHRRRPHPRLPGPDPAGCDPRADQRQSARRRSWPPTSAGCGRWRRWPTPTGSAN